MRSLKGWSMILGSMLLLVVGFLGPPSVEAAVLACSVWDASSTVRIPCPGGVFPTTCAAGTSQSGFDPADGVFKLCIGGSTGGTFRPPGRVYVEPTTCPLAITDAFPGEFCLSEDTLDIFVCSNPALVGSSVLCDSDQEWVELQTGMDTGTITDQETFDNGTGRIGPLMATKPRCYFGDTLELCLYEQGGNWSMDIREIATGNLVSTGKNIPAGLDHVIQGNGVDIVTYDGTAATAVYAGKVTFTPTATRAGVNDGSLAGDPSTPVNGDRWYNSSTGKFRCREAGATIDCIGAGAGTGDISDVWGCTTGNCNALTAAAGDSLDVGSADTSRPFTRSTTLPGTCLEGQMHHDTDSGGAEIYICYETNNWAKLGQSMTFKEVDGTPTVGNVWSVTVSNGTLTDNTLGQVTITTGAGGGGGTAYPIRPFSAIPVTAGMVYECPIDGDLMLCVTDATTLTADAIWRLGFEMPPTLPTGCTHKLQVDLKANAAAGVLRVNPKWATWAPGVTRTSLTLLAETVTPDSVTGAAGSGDTVTLGTGDANQLIRIKWTLNASTVTAAQRIAMDLTIENASTTLAVQAGLLPSIICE